MKTAMLVILALAVSVILFSIAVGRTRANKFCQLRFEGQESDISECALFVCDANGLREIWRGELSDSQIKKLLRGEK